MPPTPAAAQFLTLALLCLSNTVQAQTTPYTLPLHKGAMRLDLDGFHVTQLTAKPKGNEIGVRAHDDSHTELLAFLFLTPENRSQTAASCLEQDVKQVRKDNGPSIEQLDPLHTDSADAATIVLTYPSGSQNFYRYAGTGDQCLLIHVYPDKGSKLDVAQASAVLDRQHYDPHYVPTDDDVLRYNNIEGHNLLSSQKLPANAADACDVARPRWRSPTHQPEVETRSPHRV